jgi:hypothetical protein
MQSSNNAIAAYGSLKSWKRSDQDLFPEIQIDSMAPWVDQKHGPETMKKSPSRWLSAAPLSCVFPTKRKRSGAPATLDNVTTSIQTVGPACGDYPSTLKGILKLWSNPIDLSAANQYNPAMLRFWPGVIQSISSPSLCSADLSIA